MKDLEDCRPLDKDGEPVCGLCGEPLDICDMFGFELQPHEWGCNNALCEVNR
jgi:hypothetical protein